MIRPYDMRVIYDTKNVRHFDTKKSVNFRRRNFSEFFSGTQTRFWAPKGPEIKFVDFIRLTIYYDRGFGEKRHYKSFFGGIKSFFMLKKSDSHP